MKILNVATDPLRAEPPGIEGADRERGPDRSNQPARHIEVRPGAWDDARDPFDWFEDGEMVHLWVEEGLPDCPVWPAPFHLATGGLSFQGWGCGDVMNMLTFDRDGQ